MPELRSLGEAVNGMAERLTRLVGSQRLFVADAAHQLRTPLTALRLRLENLEVHLPDSERPKLDAALAETARLGRLVDSLLTLARADAQATAPVLVEVAAVAGGRVEAWQGPAAARGVTLSLDTGAATEAPPPALVVPGSLEQILDNLVSNAVAASSAGGAVTVRVRSRGTGTVTVSVLDEGPGITEEDRARAFERFWRGREARPGAGFGLGLAIARRLAEAAGGSVDLGARPGGGTEAVVASISPSPNHA